MKIMKTNWETIVQFASDVVLTCSIFSISTLAPPNGKFASLQNSFRDDPWTTKIFRCVYTVHVASQGILYGLMIHALE